MKLENNVLTYLFPKVMYELPLESIAPSVSTSKVKLDFTRKLLSTVVSSNKSAILIIMKLRKKDSILESQNGSHQVKVSITPMSPEPSEVIRPPCKEDKEIRDALLQTEAEIELLLNSNIDSIFKDFAWTADRTSIVRNFFSQKSKNQSKFEINNKLVSNLNFQNLVSEENSQNYLKISFKCFVLSDDGNLKISVLTGIKALLERADDTAKMSGFLSHWVCGPISKLKIRRFLVIQGKIVQEGNKGAELASDGELSLISGPNQENCNFSGEADLNVLKSFLLSE